MTKYWGYETLLDIAGCDKDKITNPEYLAQWVKSLVDAIDMVAYGEPQVFHFGHDDLAGWTVSQMITTSTITAHFNDCDGTAYINIFSCKEYDPAVAVKHFDEWFSPETIRVNYITRQA